MSFPRQERSSWTILLTIVVVAFAIRLIAMPFLYQDNLDPDRDHWNMGYEQGRVARSIATGQGFANPLFGETGPSAWPAPLYPYLLAAIFKLMGVYSKASAMAITDLNCLFSALVCIPIYFCARQSFGEKTALIAACFWAIFPHAVYGCVVLIWDTWLSSLLVSLVFLAALQLERREQWQYWAGWGVLSGVAALSGLMVLAILPGLCVWGAYGLRRRGRRWILPVLASAVFCLATIAPWVVRNYAVFHTFVPITDSLGMELKLGNSGDNSHPYDINAGPWKNDVEWQKFRRLGELAYFESKGQEALAFIHSNPGLYVWNTMRRVLNVWTDFWSFAPEYLDDEPNTPLVAALCTILSVATLWGLWKAWRRDAFAAAPYPVVLAFYPLIYYFTRTADWYRRPMDPFFVVLAAFAVTPLLPGARQHEKSR